MFEILDSRWSGPNMEIMYEIEKTVKRKSSFFTAEKFLIFSPFPVRRSSRSVGSNLSSFWAGRVSCWPARCFRCFAKESKGWMASYHKMLVNTCWKTVVSCVFTGNRAGGVHSNLDIANKSIRPFLFTILNNSLYQM